jgi:zinc protease
MLRFQGLAAVSRLPFGPFTSSCIVAQPASCTMKLSFTFLIGLLALTPAARSTPVAESIAGYEPVRTQGEIAEYRLKSNDLQVLLLPDRSVPVVTFMVTYRVGSRHEVAGTTGATHLLEHMMFKGTPTYNRERGTGIDQMLERLGAISNATTWLDRTNYYATLGSEHLETYIRIEADRMRNLWLREEDRRPEMTVVRNEFEIEENDPAQTLTKEIMATAYLAHPYHHSTIGWRSDIERVPIEKLRAFYDTYYWPNNATVSVIGDFEPAAALAMIRTHYGAIPKSPHPIPMPYTEEPPQTGPRRVTVKRPGELGLVAVAHKIPSGRHPDTPALQILSAILSSGKSSRLYRALTDQNLTLQVSGDAGFFHDPSVHTLYAYLAPESEHQKVESIMLREIERLKTDGVTSAEVTTAANQILASLAYARDGSFGLASTLNEYIAVGDWTLFLTIEDALRATTPLSVREAARKYLVEDQSTTGWFVPVSPSEPSR